MSGEPVFRKARRADLPGIVELLADDPINGHRERPREPLVQGYFDAFEAIARDDANVLVVGEQGGAIIATAQITFIPYLTRQGGKSAIIEAVRVASRLRSHGIGEKLMAHLTALAEARGCVSVQLVTSRPRVDAQRFCARIGFKDSHIGFKRDLR
ncbi:MAG: GNAT family N-acetyltransferase [Xanthobacteraceae bacterium]